jgi:hypothetical protein
MEPTEIIQDACIEALAVGLNILSWYQIEADISL